MIKKKLKRLQVQILYPAPTSSDYEPILLFEPQVSRWHSAKKKNRKCQTGNKYLKINIYNFHMSGLSITEHVSTMSALTFRDILINSLRGFQIDALRLLFDWLKYFIRASICEHQLEISPSQFKLKFFIKMII